MISGLECDFGERFGGRPVVKEAIGERSAEALTEKDEQQRHFETLVGEAIGVVAPVALQEIMGLHLS